MYIYREASKSLEMNWYPSRSNPDAEILTGIKTNIYLNVYSNNINELMN